MLTEKKMNKSGAITIPVHLRRDYGLDAGDRYDVETDGDTIVLKRTKGRCIICGDDEKLAKMNGKYVCQRCALALGGLDYA